MNGPFGNGFPYTNFHELNMDWIIKIAKDFLDQYTHIQDIITAGEASLQGTTTAGIEALQAEKTRLEGLLDAWYTTHSEDIAGQLTQAVSDFQTAAAAIGADVIASIPEDYTALTAKVNTIEDTMDAMVAYQYNIDYSGLSDIGFSINSSNKWATIPSSSDSEAVVVPIPSGYKYLECSSASGSVIAFLDTYSTPTSGTTPDYADDYPARINVPTGTSKYLLTTDTHYIFILTKNSSGTSIGITNAKLIPIDMDEIDSRLDLLEADTSLNLTTATVNSKIIDANNKWKTASGSGTGAVIAIPAGTKKIDITHPGVTVIAFLKSITNRNTDNATPDFATGYNGRIKINYGGSDSYLMGADAKYLYYSVTSTDGDDISVTAVSCGANVLRIEDEGTIETFSNNLISSIIPTLYSGWFPWRLWRAVTAAGGETHPDGFAMTDPIPVQPGNQLINLSNEVDSSDKVMAFYVVTYTDTTFVKRIQLAKNEKYIVTDDINYIRIMYGYPSSESVEITMLRIQNNFAVKFLTAAKQNEFDIPKYVAYGASTVIGAVHHFTGQATTYSPFAFPSYVGKALNLETYNHGHGSTGFLARGSGGNSKNILDAIYADDDLLQEAKLITITFGYGNDRGAGLPIGEYNDYYPYDAEGYHPSGSDGISDMLSKGFTLMGALNWCIKWISEKYPTASLVIIFGAPSENNARTITIEENEERDQDHNYAPYKLTIAEPYYDADPHPYQVPSTNAKGVYQIKTELDKLKEKLNIAIIDLVYDGFNINYYNTIATDENGQYALFSTTGTENDSSTWEWDQHPNDEGYKLYSKFLAGKIISMFKH